MSRTFDSPVVGASLALVAVAVVLYVLVKKIGKTPADMVNQLGEVGDFTADPTGATFASWYDPTQRTVFFYWLTFPDGVHHIVLNGDVQTDGSFTYNGEAYRIGVDKAGGLRAYAVNATAPPPDIPVDFGLSNPNSW